MLFCALELPLYARTLTENSDQGRYHDHGSLDHIGNVEWDVRGTDCSSFDFNLRLSLMVYKEWKSFLLYSLDWHLHYS